MTDLKEFITRIEAQAKYNRSKTSFIRDVDQARERGDHEFLNNFKVVMKDGTSKTGVEATKKALKDNDHLKPEWYINESLLETRYWLRGKKAKVKTKPASDGQENKEQKGSAGSPRQSNGPYIALLEQTNADLRSQISVQNEMLSKLSSNQQQSNVLMKSLTDLLSGNASEEAMVALGILQKSIPQNEQAADQSVVDIQPVTDQPTGKESAKQETLETDSSEKGSVSDTPIWQRDMFWFINKRFRK